MKLSVKAVTIACALTFGAAVLAGGVVALMYPDWGARYMDLMGAVFPGVEGVTFGAVMVATLYALVDGAIFGALYAWLYNRFAGGGNAPAV